MAGGPRAAPESAGALQQTAMPRALVVVFQLENRADQTGKVLAGCDLFGAERSRAGSLQRQGAEYAAVAGQRNAARATALPPDQFCMRQRDARPASGCAGPDDTGGLLDRRS